MIKDQGKRTPFYKQSEDLDDMKEYIRRAAVSNWHQVGTCAMLPRDKNGVVDETLVVYGTQNLRVVDASVMPLIPRANTMASVYAIAERAADIIKKAATDKTT